MKRMLFELVVEGVDTNQEFVEDLLDFFSIQTR